ncbi:MAG: MBL fold metallo-hydrolase [Bacteroidota bacterium]|nr:MBL fold metallo-hydrolase [Bacteroidota bacterium]
MKLTVLTENVAGGKFLAEHGLSYLIEHDEQTILFDTGHTDVFLKNAKQLGIDLQDVVDYIVLSHGHWDHGDGLQYIESKTLITHPNAFIKRTRKNGSLNIGLTLDKETLEKRFKLITSANPYQISESILFLGEIPRTNNFESQSTNFADENGVEDFVPDDSALAIVEDKSLIIVSGCAHSGICNICEYAKKVTGISKISAVIGGFHLKHIDEQTQQTIAYFKNEQIAEIIPSHCTELPALSAFYSEFKLDQLKTGQVLSY